MFGEFESRIMFWIVGARISLSFPVIWNGSPSLQFLQGFREPSLFTSSEKWKLGWVSFDLPLNINSAFSIF